jgi:hypothetical protein
MLKKVYGEKDTTRKLDFEWLKRYKDVNKTEKNRPERTELG